MLFQVKWNVVQAIDNIYSLGLICNNQCAMHTENVDDVNIMEYSSMYEYFCKRMA